MDARIGTKKSIEGWQAWFRIGNQTFYLDERETEDEALFYAKMLVHALLNHKSPDPYEHEREARVEEERQAKTYKTFKIIQ